VFGGRSSCPARAGDSDDGNSDDDDDDDDDAPGKHRGEETTNP